MNDKVEKSCWGITLWAVAIVLGVALVSSFVVKSEQSVAAGLQQSTVLSTASTISN